ncbi:MAG: hypothetical protein MO846_10565 [Candidatus Devosia symbiotica]|nr:hypothetical protein [Candidatus Devosia symbiotica]
MRHIDAIAGSLLNAEPEAELASGLLDRLMDALNDDDRVEVTTHDARYKATYHYTLQRYLPHRLEGVRWKWTGPGRDNG